MKLIRISKVYKKYLLFYTSIVLLSCVFIGMSVLLVSVNELNQVMVEEQMSKLTFTVEDLSKQYEVMQNIAQRIEVSLYYTPYYLNYNKYNEVVMIKDFSKYIGYSPLVLDYFLFYSNSEYLFTPWNKTLADSFIKNNFGTHKVNTTNILDVIQSVTSDSMISIGTDRYLFVFPLRLSFSNLPEGDAILGFIITKDSILNRIKTISGGFENEIYVYFDGEPITYESQRNDIKMLHTSSGRFCLKYSMSSEGIYAQNIKFTRIVLRIIVSLALLLLIIAALAAHVTYNPINKLMKKHFTNDEQVKNEFEYIDNMLVNGMLSQKQRSVLIEQVDEQCAIIRQQLILLLLSGEYNNDIDAHMKNVGIQLDRKHFCVLTTSLLTQESASALISMIEELSDDSIRYYAVHLEAKGRLAIVLNMQFPESLDDAIELIQELGSTYGFDLKINAGFVCENPMQLQGSLLVALSMELMKPGDLMVFHNERCDDRMNWYEDSDLSKMIEALENSNEKLALLHLNLFAMTLERDYSSMLYKRYIYIDAMNAVLRRIHRWDASLAREMMSNVFLVKETEAFIREMSVIISQSCTIKQEYNSNENKRDENIVAYINDHYTDYNTTLEKVAEVFMLSSRQISRILKKMTGRQFKKHITLLKIDQAKKLLIEEGLTVKQVSQSLNYSSIPYFIKTFKDATGYTPANYKKEHNN